MAMVLAPLTKPGQVYRPTRLAIPGTYLTRPNPTKRTTSRAFVDRLLIKGDALAGFWAQVLKADPDAVLMHEHQRGTDWRGVRFETKRPVLCSSDARLRVVQARPGYTESYAAGGE